MKLQTIEARDLPDAWYRCLYNILEHGNVYTIDRGSYKGQQRLEFDHVTIHIKYPGVRPLLPEISPSLGVPNPVAEGYLDEYLPYLMTDARKEGEDYTYGERLNAGAILHDRALMHDADMYGGEVNQIEEVIKMFKEDGHSTNQACMEIGQPGDIIIEDPPCLRLIDCRIKDNKLHFIIYFRSWDLWNGFPANLGGLQLLKEYMSEAIGVEDGEIIANSKGLHLYSYVWDIAKQITYKDK